MATEQQRIDREHPSALAEFMVFLMQCPGLDAVCDRLLISWPGPDAINRVSIGLIARDGILTMSGCLASRVEAGARSAPVSIWDEVPAAVALREGEVLVLGDRDDIERRFPQFADGMPGIASMIVAPLLSRSKSLGVCAVSSGVPLCHPQESAAMLSEMSLALSLYVRPTAARRAQPPARTLRHGSGAPALQRFAPAELSTRQVAVLQGLSEGLTNRQIAERIRFSESTVRHATMRIYAYLGVRGRREAIAVARALGMVASSGSEAECSDAGGEAESP